MASTYSLVLIALCSLIYFNDGVKANCGGLIEETNGTITSPLYPENYPPNQDCLWEIKGPPNKNIWFHFTVIQLEVHDSCGYDFVTIKSKRKDGSIRVHGKFCDSRVNNFNFSDSNTLYIQFKSDANTALKGFEMEFYSVPFECGGLLEDSVKHLFSPRWPRPYPPDLNCTWTFQAPLNHIIKLKFINFDIEESNDCVQDYLTTQSKMADGEIRQHGRLCGKKPTFPIFSESNVLLIQFVTHSNKGHRGFSMVFKSEECGGLVAKTNGSLSSLFFPIAYPPNLMCEWTILVPPQRIIKLNFLEFEIEDSSECVQEYVTVQSKMLDHEIRGHGKFCGVKTTPAIVSDSNTLLIKFKSHNNKERRGFNATFRSDECGGVIEGGKGNISSPFFPDLYPSNIMCKWNFLMPPQHKIKLNFRHFEIEEGDGCPNDFLQIQSVTTDGKIHEYGKYCGDSRPSPITSKDGIILKFVSDRSIERKGFIVEYFIDKLTDFESSVSLEKSTTPVYKATTTPVYKATATPVYEATTKTFYEVTTTPTYEATTIPKENQYDDITKDFITSREEENTFSDKNESTISPATTGATFPFSPNQPTTEEQKKEAENVIMKNDPNILSALTLLTQKVADMEERQIMLFNHYESMFTKLSRSSKDASLEDKKFPFN